jgi:TonB family protein
MSIAPSRVKLSLTLLESGRTTSVGHRMVVGASIAGQVAAAFGVVMGVAAVRDRLPDSKIEEKPSFLAPLRQTMPRPIQERLSFVALGGPVAPLVQSAPTTPAPRPTEAPLPEASGGDGQTVSDARDEIPMRAFSDIEVDSAVVRDSTSAGPEYPPLMLAKGIEGSVLASFIVDTTGRPDLTSFIALEATHPEFTEAVRLALPKMKFRPAMMAGVRVRQLVEQRFGFRVINPVVATPMPPKTPSD